MTRGKVKYLRYGAEAKAKEPKPSDYGWVGLWVSNMYDDA